MGNAHPVQLKLGGQRPPCPPSSIKVIFLHSSLMYKFGFYWPSTAFIGLLGPLMIFLSQKISFWVKINCKWTLSTNQVSEAYSSLWFTVILGWSSKVPSANFWILLKYVKLYISGQRLKYRGWVKIKYTNGFKSGGNIFGQSASKH